jgi:hypothetical protein
VQTTIFVRLQRKGKARKAKARKGKAIMKCEGTRGSRNVKGKGGVCLLFVCMCLFVCLFER